MAGAGELLESVQLFDVYTSEQVGAGMRSLAYKLTFRAPDRTLTVEEAVAARDAAVASAAARPGAGASLVRRGSPGCRLTRVSQIVKPNSPISAATPNGATPPGRPGDADERRGRDDEPEPGDPPR